ncbi:MAG: alpha/beta fold hydrolase [Pseudomonadota bacterium]
MLSFVLDGPDDAPAILCLHGLGMVSWCWDPVRADLTDFGALVPDMPGHGGSAAMPWETLAHTADSVIDVVETLPAGRPVYLVGQSLGAYVGWLMLGKRPDRFARAVLSGFHIGHLRWRPLYRLAYVINGSMFAVPSLLWLFSGVLGDPQAGSRFVEGAKVIRPRTIRRAGIQAVDFRSPTGLTAPPVPLLAVSGSKEPGAIRLTPNRLAAENPNVDALVLDGRDHLWPLKEPVRYSAILRSQFKS